MDNLHMVIKKKFRVKFSTLFFQSSSKDIKIYRESQTFTSHYHREPLLHMIEQSIFCEYCSRKIILHTLPKIGIEHSSSKILNLLICLLTKMYLQLPNQCLQCLCVHPRHARVAKNLSHQACMFPAEVKQGEAQLVSVLIKDDRWMETVGQCNTLQEVLALDWLDGLESLSRIFCSS